jgi:hypothetical protein
MKLLLELIKKKTYYLRHPFQNLQQFAWAYYFCGWQVGPMKVCETEDTSNCCTMKLILKVVVL